MATKKLTKEQIINLFLNDHFEWEKYRKYKTKNKKPVDLTHMICKVDLHNYMDNNLDFTESQFRASSFQDTSITSCKFVDCSFNSTDFESTIFNFCNFIRCSFYACSFKRTDFIKCKMDDCYFNACEVHQGTYYENNLINTQMIKSNLKYCIFKYCNLQDVEFPSSICSKNNLFDNCKNLPGLVKFDMQKHQIKEISNKVKRVPQENVEEKYDTPVISSWRRNSDFET